jgi:hypothetical protein
MVCWLNPKFNMQWSYYQQLYYPFLDDFGSVSLGLTAYFVRKSVQRLRARCVSTALRNNFFLHFAGGSRDYQMVDGKASRRGKTGSKW